LCVCVCVHVCVKELVHVKEGEKKRNAVWGERTFRNGPRPRVTVR
jgi:hypothetical protein